MIRDILKKATKGAVTWLGNTLGLPTGVTKGASDIAESLFTKKGHPEQKFSTGSLETLGDIDRTELIDFYNQH